MQFPVSPGENIKERDEFASVECTHEEGEETLNEEPDAKIRSDDNNSAIEETEVVASKINIDHSQSQPILSHSFHTAPDEQSMSLVSWKSGRSQVLKAVHTPTGSKTLVSNTLVSLSSGMNKSCKSVPNISNALSTTLKPVTRSITSKRLTDFMIPFMISRTRTQIIYKT